MNEKTQKEHEKIQKELKITLRESKKDGRSKIPKMKEKELKELHLKLEALSRNAYDFKRQKMKELENAEQSETLVDRLIERIKYYRGKAKGFTCPAFRSKDGYMDNARCFAHEEFKWMGYRYLFVTRCIKCKLTSEEALRKASFNAVFEQAMKPY